MFDELKNIFEKSERPEMLSSTYMINRFLSMYPDTFLVAENLNRLSSRLPGWAAASYLFLSVKKEKPAPFIKYVGKKKGKDIDEKLRSEIVRVFNCSDNHADEIIELLRKKKVNLKAIFGMRI